MTAWTAVAFTFLRPLWQDPTATRADLAAGLGSQRVTD